MMLSLHAIECCLSLLNFIFSSIHFLQELTLIFIKRKSEMNANDIAHVTIEPHVSRFCLILADIFGKGYSNSKAGINIGNETPDENYLRNNYGAALAEAGLAVYAFKDPMSAILGRLITLRSAILNGRPTDAGCDLRDTLNSGYAIDVKCRRYREDSTSTDTTLNLILRKHELRSESHVFVLASLPFPQDNSEYMSVRSWDVNLLGWCYQHELLENTGELPYGDYYCPFRFLRPMSELDVQAQLVGIENEQQLSGE
jgi:hypothetical protein